MTEGVAEKPVSEAEQKSVVEGAPDPGRPWQKGSAPGALRFAPQALGELASAPVLTGLAALAAFIDMSVNRVLFPWLSGRIEHARLIRADPWGDLAGNLAALASLVALGVGICGFVLHERSINLFRRLMLVCFSFIVLGTGAFAAFAPQHGLLTGQLVRVGALVRFGMGGAHVLAVLVMLVALRAVHHARERSLAILGCLLGSFALAAQVVELLGRRMLSAHALGGYELVRGLGECFYLVLLVAAAALFVPRIERLRGKLALVLGCLVFGLVASAALVAQAELGRDYRLLLYNAQRVAWFLESAPGLYALPLALALGGAVAAWASPDCIRVQAGMAVVLLLSAGYAPRAPGRLLMLTLGMTALARALIALDRRRRVAGVVSVSAQKPGNDDTHPSAPLTAPAD